MDPYYFLNNFNIKENENDLELYDILNMSQCGSWNLGDENCINSKHL